MGGSWKGKEGMVEWGGSLKVEERMVGLGGSWKGKQGSGEVGGSLKVVEAWGGWVRRVLEG